MTNVVPSKLGHVVVTGASRVIGAALAREASARGARVTLVARSPELLDAIAEETDGTAPVADLGTREAVDGLIPRIEAAAGPVDVLINNAAVVETGPFVELDSGSIRRQIDLNLTAPMELSRQVLPGMLERGRGAVVMLSSLSGELSMRNHASYAASKAGLDLFTQNLQRELSRTPVHVMLVLLGAVQTDLLEGSRGDEHVARLGDRFRALGTLRPERVARETLDAIGRRRRFLTIPKTLAPTPWLRRAPSRLADVAAIGLP